MKRKLKYISLIYVLPSHRTFDILKIGVGTHNWMYVRKKDFHVSCTWYKSLDWCDVDVLHPRIRGWRTSSVMYLDEIHFIILMSYFQYFAQLCLTLPTLLSPTWTKPREQPLALLLRPLVLVVFGLVLDPGLLWSVPSQPCNGSSMTVLRYVMSEIKSSRNSDKNFRRSLLLWLNSDRQRLKYRNGEK